MVAGTIDAIRPEARDAQVDGRTMAADALVVALGAERDPGRVPGFREHAIDVYDEGASESGAAAIDAFTGGRVVIGIFGVPYPCPPGPYELALLLGERLAARDVPGGIFVFTPQSGSLPVLGDAGCAAFDGRLASEGITLRPKTNATAVEPGAVVAADTGSRSISCSACPRTVCPRWSPRPASRNPGRGSRSIRRPSRPASRASTRSVT